MPTIAIIDSFPVLRKGLIILLRNRFKKTDFMEAGHPCELACTTGRRKCPDLLILGLNEKRQHEFHAILSEAKAHFPATPVVIYGENLRADIAGLYIQSELNGYVVKSTDSTEIIRCVEDVLNGRRYMSQTFTDAILRSVYSGANVPDLRAMIIGNGLSI